MAKPNTPPEKISEALKLLDEAAVDKKEEIVNLISDKYKNLKETVKEVNPALRHSRDRVVELATEARRYGEERAKYAAKHLDEDVHERPWNYIGGAILGGLVIGILIGRK